MRIIQNENLNGEVFNIGNPNAQISIYDLAEKIISMTGNKNIINKIDMRDSDRKDAREIYVRYPDISKAETLLGYSPTIDIDEGINKVIDHGDIPTSIFDPLSSDND